MKTKKLTSVIAIVFLFSVSYIANAGQPAKGNYKSNAIEDSSMTNHNHNHNSSSMMNNNSSMMNQGDSTMMGHGDMMAMMQKCQSMVQMMQNMHKQMNDNQCCSTNGHVTNKNDNSLIDPGTKKGSYGYFQYQRQKDNAGNEKK